MNGYESGFSKPFNKFLYNNNMSVLLLFYIILKLLILWLIFCLILKFTLVAVLILACVAIISHFTIK